MVEMDLNHLSVVKESLNGNRAVDEQTFASMAILNERLQRLKERGHLFSGITFSPDVKKLANQKKTVAVC
ncbi:MAG: hypothetical protein MUO22_03085 [Sedimentisphaerales bacterium]|jgi:hypothetical protein|nr:hypothetical protein [Sedimentisphaerales bacterium]